MSCLVCHQERKVSGAACAECLDELNPSIAITPEQVRMHGAQPTTAVLVDCWGRTHPVQRRTIVGRIVEDEDGLMILDATISRRHAALELRDGGWHLSDFGSANGTYIEGRRIQDDTRIRDGERVRFGAVSFFFLDGVTAPPDIDTSALVGLTVRDPFPGGMPPAPDLITIELREPTGGGGGVAVIDGKPVQLTLPQFELIALLYQRARSGGEGFASASELARTLSLDSTEPSEDHVRQLVRRLRRVLFKAGITNLIESRYGAGYRLVLLRA